MTRRTLAAALVIIGTGMVQPAAQTPPPPPQRQPFSASATAILVDVVVRDRRGRPLTTLDAADFEISEDGRPQKIDTFTKVSRGTGIGLSVAWRTDGTTMVTPPKPDTNAEASGRGDTSHPPDDGGATAIVFDQLAAESLRLAQKATLTYVPMNGDSDVQVGVFATDPGIRVLQPFTTDRGRIRRAVSAVLPSGVSAAEQKAERRDELMERRRDLNAARDPMTGGASASSATMAQNASAIGQSEMELRLLQTELNMLRASEHLDRENRGYDTVLALAEVIRSLASFPGRKTIVFFSEGLPASPALSARLDTIIDIANRANVTAYAVDANGLRATSTSDTMKKEMAAFAEERFRQLATAADRSDQPLTMEFERVEDTLRLDSRTGLARLADETGGFLVEQSNDLTSAFRRIDEDSQFHYLLTYSPHDAAFDGRFRTIQVKVRRPGAQVFARKGYRALRRAPSVNINGDEAPALALLERSPVPNAFPVHAASLSFPEPARPGLSPVLVRVTTDHLRFDLDPRRATYTADATIVVRVRDNHGRDVQKVSQQYLLTGDAKDVGAARRGEILFYRELDLPHGTYSMETVVFDAVAAAGSARISTITVPRPNARELESSSLIIVARIEETGNPAATVSRASAPLWVGSLLLYPNLGEAISKARTPDVPFYFVLYGISQAPTARVQLLSNGRSIADVPLQLPAAIDARIQHVGRLPIATLPAGTYELRIAVTDGAREVTRSAFLTITE